jgi:hypothetical protein
MARGGTGAPPPSCALLTLSCSNDMTASDRAPEVGALQVRAAAGRLSCLFGLLRQGQYTKEEDGNQRGREGAGEPASHFLPPGHRRASAATAAGGSSLQLLGQAGVEEDARLSHVP